MKIQVGFPVIGNRIAPDYAKIISEGNFSATMIKTVDCKIIVNELTCDEKDRSSLNIEFTEDYDEESTFAGVMKRAESFAIDYCNKLGIGAD